MKEITKSIRLDKKNCTVRLLIIEESDRRRLKILYNTWRKLFDLLKKFRARGITLPEGISESAFCLEFNSARVLDVQGSSTSFDTINLKTWAREQIKATSVISDLTSFGPKSIWDDLYWLDFYREGKWDGSFDTYKIPKKLIINFPINKNQSFLDQQKQGKRPRLCIKKLIKSQRFKPIKTCYI